MKNAITFVLALVVAFFVVGYLLPKDFHVERSIEIDRPVGSVYSEVIDLKRNEAWNPWLQKNPDMELTYSETSSGAGASYSWTSENAGSGTLTISKVEPLQRIENTLDFDGSPATGFWIFEAEGDKTKVTWGFEGTAEGPIGAYFALLMDSMAGSDFEEGLANLKTVVEQK